MIPLLANNLGVFSLRLAASASGLTIAAGAGRSVCLYRACTLCDVRSCNVHCGLRFVVAWATTSACLLALATAECAGGEGRATHASVDCLQRAACTQRTRGCYVRRLA
eukprot:78249-Pleurochrysis_carterae.AAC.1